MLSLFIVHHGTFVVCLSFLKNKFLCACMRVCESVRGGACGVGVGEILLTKN